MQTPSPAEEKFRAALGQILKVPKAEILRREKEAKQKRKDARAKHG